MRTTLEPSASPPHRSAVARATEHVAWIDVLRGLAILLLLLLHACNVPNFRVGVPGPAWLDPVNAFFAPFRMTALMFLSGMLVDRSLAKPLGRNLLGKVQHLAWPYLLWTTVLLLSAGWTYFATFYLTDPSAWVATGYLWYLFYLLCFTIVAPAIRWIPAWLTPLLCLTAAAVLPQGTEPAKLAFYATFYFAGHAFQRRRHQLMPWLRRPVVVLPLAAAAIGLGVATATISYALYDDVLVVPLVLAGIAAAIVGAERIADRRWAAPVAWVGRHSIVFYTVHWPIMLAASVALVAVGWKSWLTLGLLVATLVLATPLAVLRRRRPVRWLFEAPLLGRWTRRPAQAPAAATTSSAA